MSEPGKFDFKKIKKHAQELRNNMTESEKILWQELKGKKLSGYRFLKQHPILYKGDLIRLNYFIADFFCFEKKIIIELDGPIHEETEEYDQFRDSELKELGFNVLRIKNKDLKNITEVRRKILSFITEIN
jgi:very-short-patch-repair endonuclease